MEKCVVENTDLKYANEYFQTELEKVKDKNAETEAELSKE